MRFLVGLGCVIFATLVFLVDPVRRPPTETVDAVVGCVHKYWPGKPIEQWTDAPDMDPACRTILNKAREANR